MLRDPISATARLLRELNSVSSSIPKGPEAINR